MATAQRSDFLIVAATLAAVAGGTLMIIAPRQTTKPGEIAVKGKPVAAPTRMKLPPQGPRTPRETELKKKEVEIPRMRVPAPIVRPEKKGKKREKKSKRAERTERAERPKRVSYCDGLRARLSKTPTRVFSCREMKAARSCERPGDRGMATAAQIAKGWQCWNNGEL